MSFCFRILTCYNKLKINQIATINTVTSNGSLSTNTDLSDLPLLYTSSKGQKIRFEWLKEETLPDIYDIIQRIGVDSDGMDPDVFSPIEKLRQIVLPLISRQQAVQGDLLAIYFCKIVLKFMIHPCDPTVVICYLIWPCDIAVHITHLVSHSSLLSYNTVIKGYFRLGV